MTVVLVRHFFNMENATREISVNLKLYIGGSCIIKKNFRKMMGNVVLT